MFQVRQDLEFTVKSERCGIAVTLPACNLDSNASSGLNHKIDITQPPLYRVGHLLYQIASAEVSIRPHEPKSTLATV